MNRKKDLALTLTGMAIGLALGTPIAAAALTASPSTQRFYLDGQPLSLEAYAINGNNYVKLRDIGRAADFGVTYDAATNSVYIAPEAHYQADSPAKTASPVNVSSCKGTNLSVGERSGLIIGPNSVRYTVTSGNPSVVSVEQVSGTWVAVANGAGTAVITATAPDGSYGSVTLQVGSVSPLDKTCTDLDANLDIRLEMVRLINQVRQENNVPALTINGALMNAAQDCSTQGFTTHTVYENEAGPAYGYTSGYCVNLTIFTGVDTADIAQHAVDNWVNSTYHLQTMVDPACDSIGVGVTIVNGKATCYMFAGDSNSINPYA